MGSKTKEMRRQEEAIKDRIVRAHRAGMCDKDGNSVTDKNGNLAPFPRKKANSTVKRYVIREGKCVEKT